VSYRCPRCQINLVENPDDEVNDYELEGAQVRHTIKRCAEVERAGCCDHGSPACEACVAHDTMLAISSSRKTRSDVVADLVKELAEKTGLDPEKFSGHSLRAGFATTAAAAGKSLHNIMRQTRHKDQRVAMTYIRHGSLFRENAADGIEVEEEEK